MTSLKFRLHAVGVLAPGLTSLSGLAQFSSGQITIDPMANLDLPAPARLPPNERRRATTAVRLALACIEQISVGDAYDVASVRAVFATDDGVGEVSQQMLEAISTTRQVSPLVFPNSVHGVAAGYFSIAFQNKKPTTTISQGAESFAAGLLAAVIEANVLNEVILLVAYDAPMLAPMDEVLPIVRPTATAWVISSRTDKECERLADFELTLEPDTALSDLAFPAWIPKQWHANSSIQGYAALGLIQAPPDTCRQLALGNCTLTIRTINKGK